MKNTTLVFLFLLSHALKSRAQETIRLTNPSFEDKPICCQAPKGWESCGSPEETPPDIQPGSFDVDLPPADGKTYLSMVVRDNNTTEAVSQQLPDPLEPGWKYVLKVYLARSESFLSKSRINQKDVNYATPVLLRVWGGKGDCDKAELLAESPLVTQSEWQKFELDLNPENQSDYLILEAWYKTPSLFPYNGNILVDNLELLKLEE